MRKAWEQAMRVKEETVLLTQQLGLPHNGATRNLLSVAKHDQIRGKHICQYLDGLPLEYAKGVHTMQFARQPTQHMIHNAASF
jgi:hypothetical protein